MGAGRGLFWLLLGFFISAAAGGPLSRLRPRSVCYDGWGCFSRRAPFDNTGSLPQAPELLGVRFFLHTRRHPARQRTLLELDWSDQRIGQAVDMTKDTRVIVHGYLDSGDQPWVHNMVRELLEKADQNVLVIDWRRGASSVDYLQVAANTRLVGKMVAAMLEKWVRVGADPSSFHLIGASLGAHISGYVGSALRGIGRITGLDPAGPSFANTSPAVRLDPTDAIFVDVIHTNAVAIIEMGLGYIEPCGTVDFYPNKGKRMPGCHTSLFGQLIGILGGQDARDAMGCSHLRAVDYFLDSINSQCDMVASPCSFPDILRRRHTCRHHAHPCQDCVTMGYDVDLNASPGVYYVRTGEEAPFCISQSRVENDDLLDWRRLFN
ncbi:hypothetical protein ACOMHN_026034 [Nucella lapillus]